MISKKKNDHWSSVNNAQFDQYSPFLFFFFIAPDGDQAGSPHGFRKEELLQFLRVMKERTRIAWLDRIFLHGFMFRILANQQIYLWRRKLNCSPRNLVTACLDLVCSTVFKVLERSRVGNRCFRICPINCKRFVIDQWMNQSDQSVWGRFFIDSSSQIYDTVQRRRSLQDGDAIEAHTDLVEEITNEPTVGFSAVTYAILEHQGKVDVIVKRTGPVDRTCRFRCLARIKHRSRSSSICMLLALVIDLWSLLSSFLSNFFFFLNCFIRVQMFLVRILIQWNERTKKRKNTRLI